MPRIRLRNISEIQKRNNKNNYDGIESKPDKYDEIEDVFSTPFHEEDDRQTGKGRQRIWTARDWGRRWRERLTGRILGSWGQCCLRRWRRSCSYSFGGCCDGGTRMPRTTETMMADYVIPFAVAFAAFAAAFLAIDATLMSLQGLALIFQP